MATSAEYAEFVCERMRRFGEIRCRKMFGEYMVYLNEKPVLTLCDSTPFVKMLPELSPFLSETGFPYEGAKEHYLLDVENDALLDQVIPLLEAVMPFPKKRSKLSL